MLRRSLSPILPTVLGAVLLLLVAGRASAEPRTFLFGPSDLTTASDAFAAQVLAKSDVLGKRTVRLSRGTIRLANNACPSLTADPLRLLTRVRLVDGPARGGQLASKRPNATLSTALATLGGASWLAPGDGATRQPLWTLEPPVEPGLRTFAAVGFPRGDQQGAINAPGALSTASATFRAELDVPGMTGAEPTALVMALTTELVPSKPGRRVKKNECVLLAKAVPVDVIAIQALLDATPLSSTTRNRLNTLLDYARNWVEKDNPTRAVRALKKFVLEVSRRSEGEIASAHAEAIMQRTLLAGESLEF
jgi:hypothetical protein